MSSKVCALISCSKLIDENEDSSVDIQCHQDYKINSNTSKIKNQIKWGLNQEASLHEACWKLILTCRLSRQERLMIQKAKKTVELHESLKIVKQKAENVAKILKSAKYAVAFTGAGISTSAGIGDFRGKSGKWTLEEQNIESLEPSNEEEIDYEYLRPTLTHELLLKLVNMGFIKHVISQNGDGLHELSGLTPGETLSELHGNVFVEKCSKCGERFHRNFYVLDDQASEYFELLQDGVEPAPKKPRLRWMQECSTCGLNHRTCRKCSNCDEYLQDTIINFGDDLEEEVYCKAQSEAERCDVMLCLGSTITVTPASNLTKFADQLIICNRQEIDINEEQSNKITFIHTDCDILMSQVGKILLQKEFQPWKNSLSKKLDNYNSKREKHE